MTFISRFHVTNYRKSSLPDTLFFREMHWNTFGGPLGELKRSPDQLAAKMAASRPGGGKIFPSHCFPPLVSTTNRTLRSTQPFILRWSINREPVFGWCSDRNNHLCRVAGNTVWSHWHVISCSSEVLTRSVIRLPNSSVLVWVKLMECFGSK